MPTLQCVRVSELFQLAVHTAPFHRQCQTMCSKAAQNTKRLRATYFLHGTTTQIAHGRQKPLTQLIIQRYLRTENTTLSPGLKTINFQSGGQSCVLFQGQNSNLRRNKQGVSQSGILSPLLFNFYISRLPHYSPLEGFFTTSYDDD